MLDHRSGLVSTDDQRAGDELVKELLSDRNRLIGFVGAGVSCAAGYPTWIKLLENIHKGLARPVKDRRKRLSKDLLDFTDVLWRAEEYRAFAKTDERFLRVLGSALNARKRPGRLPRVLHDLIEIPFNHFITTNYDDALEAASRRTPKGKVLPSRLWTNSGPDAGRHLDALRGNARCVVHLHGAESTPASIILTDSNYADFYLGTDRNSRQLSSILAINAVCFIGCSLVDPHLLRTLESVRAFSPSARHYALMPDEGVGLRQIRRTMFAKRYGVTALFYSQGKDYAGFPKLVSALRGATASASSTARGLRARKPPQPEPPYPKPKRTVTDSADPNRGRFGGKAARDGLVLRAEVSASTDPEWFDIELTVEDDSRFETRRPLSDHRGVRFHLHPTFPTPILPGQVRGGRARLRRYAWGAFTVGVEVPGRTCLELDLSELPAAPAVFRER